MPEDDVPPLTDIQIRESFLRQIERTLAVRLDIRALEVALIDKKLLTQADIDRAFQKVSAEGTDFLARAEDAIKKGLPEGIQ